LSENLAEEAAEEGDTPPSYSTQQTALSQESQLFSDVNFMRAHHTQYIMLRATNPLDLLFLARFFHHAFPEGRVITVGSEILFTRELDSAEFRGSMALTNYPLLPQLRLALLNH
jgi:hypothetical protein